MHGGGRHAEEALHIGFGWWAPLDLRIGVDEGEVLSLGIGKRSAALVATVAARGMACDEPEVSGELSAGVG
jgi:hypothetical protein